MGDKVVGRLLVNVCCGVDHATAEALLKLLEIYVNQTGAEIIGTREDDGRTRFEFARSVEGGADKCD